MEVVRPKPSTHKTVGGWPIIFNEILKCSSIGNFTIPWGHRKGFGCNHSLTKQRYLWFCFWRLYTDRPQHLTHKPQETSRDVKRWALNITIHLTHYNNKKIMLQCMLGTQKLLTFQQYCSVWKSLFSSLCSSSPPLVNTIIDVFSIKLNSVL